MKSRTRLWAAVLLVVAVLGVVGAVAQDTELAEGAEAAEAADAGAGAKMGFFNVVSNAGWLGVVLWLALAACSVAAVALAIDSFITIKEDKIAPPELVEQVRDAMEQGDVMKAMQHCEATPTPLSNILSAGFSNVQEGFDVIQDVVSVQADYESERLLQRVSYLNVCANLAPMLGLLGTVQGMIYAFATLATMQAGAAQQAMLALNIAQALWTTAAGLVIAIPAMSFYTFFKNRATKIILAMEHLTMDLIKALRNVEVVEEEA